MKFLIFLSLFITSTLYAQSNRFSDRDLFDLAKVWGFIKYYHPAASQGKIDWDDALLKSLCNPNKSSTDEIITSWLDQADQSSSDQIAVRKSECDSITLRNYDDSWINKLNPANRKRLLDLTAQPKNVGSFYSNPVENSIRFNSTNEKTYTQFSADIKMLELFRIWNAIEYFYPYKYLLDEKWDHVLQKYIPLFKKIKTETDYKSAVMQLAAEIQDSHVEIKKTLQYDVVGKFSAPFIFQIADGKVVITGIKDEAKMMNANLEVGDLITKINGKSVLESLNINSKYFAYSNEAVKLREAYSYLFSSNDPNSVIEGVKKNGKAFKTVMERTERIFQNEWDKDGIPNYQLFYKNKTYTYLTYNEKESRLNPTYPLDDKVYFEFASLKATEIPSLMEKYQNTKGMVFDLRGYNNDGSLIKIFDYLLSKPEHFGIMTQADFSQPGKFCFVDNIIDKTYKFAGKNNPNAYKGQIVVLINEYTQSAAELWAMIFKKVPNVIFVGSQTAGADGNKTSIKMTDGNEIIFSGLGIYYPNGDETQRIGIQPDIVVRPTVESIRNNQDLLLLKAFELIDQKK
ncbi:S41 family peptidase [Chryseobacterium wangxinyae]|uniref:S41 family peptidase n=1 Tax=Chryseobacterium sp. CY353 TaxID=2997334 RepID=UPI00226D7683|nr:S41 family peptidase [Chryseobacterium sp. CY353]MCY0970084.1 S41 family peptidase [Chryseobacterium sp. CY353]